MSESFSTVTVLGALRQPVSVETTPSGAPVGCFDLILREKTTAGQWFSTVVGCQLWGKHLDAAQQLQPGQACLFSGKLAKRRRGAVWELVVSGFELSPFTLPTPMPDAAALSRN